MRPLSNVMMSSLWSQIDVSLTLLAGRLIVTYFFVRVVQVFLKLCLFLKYLNYYEMLAMLDELI